MSDKLVTHEDLAHLRYMRAHYTSETAAVRALLDRLIAAAEADTPPLPEGWVLFHDDVDSFPFWHEDGGLLAYRPNSARNDHYFSHKVGEGHFTRDRLTPLRPTVTEADVEKAARAARAAYFNGVDAWDAARQDTRGLWMKTARAAIDALGIEVQP